MKIKFDTDDNIPLNQIIYFPTITVIIRSITQKDDKYSHNFSLMNVCIKYKMLEYDRIDISEGIDIDKTNKSKECNICHYWYFLDKNFNYDPYLCNGCHDLMQKAMSFKNVAIVFIKRNDYRIHFSYISKNDAIALMTNSNLNDKIGFYKKFFIIYKI